MCVSLLLSCQNVKNMVCGSVVHIPPQGHSYFLLPGNPCNKQNHMQTSLVPRPHPQGGKGYTSSAFWGWFLNSVTPIWFMPCGLHVIIMWHYTIEIYYCVWEQLMRCHAKMMRRHASHMTYCILHAPKCARCMRVGSGNETTADNRLGVARTSAAAQEQNQGFS